MVRHGWLFEPHSTSSTGGTSAGGPQALRSCDISALTQPAACAPTRDAEEEDASPLLQERAFATPDAEEEEQQQQQGRGAQEACAYIPSPAPLPLADKPLRTGAPEAFDEIVERQGLRPRLGLPLPRLPPPRDALPACLRTPAPDTVTSHTATPAKTNTAREDALVEQDPGSSLGFRAFSVGVARRALQPCAQAASSRWTGGIRNMSEVRTANFVSSI